MYTWIKLLLYNNKVITGTKTSLSILGKLSDNFGDLITKIM